MEVQFYYEEIFKRRKAGWHRMRPSNRSCWMSAINENTRVSQKKAVTLNGVKGLLINWGMLRFTQHDKLDFWDTLACTIVPVIFLTPSVTNPPFLHNHPYCPPHPYSSGDNHTLLYLAVEFAFFRTGGFVLVPSIIFINSTCWAEQSTPLYLNVS